MQLGARQELEVNSQALLRPLRTMPLTAAGPKGAAQQFVRFLIGYLTETHLEAVRNLIKACEVGCETQSTVPAHVAPCAA